MKVILMYPNLKWSEWMERTLWKLHPYNLALLAAMLDCDVSIIDATMDNLTTEQFANIIRRERPDVLGISVLTNEYIGAGFVAARVAKRVDPAIRTIFGGVAATSLPGFVISDPDIDYVVRGEGEYVLRELCGFFEGGAFPKRGVLYKKGGKVVDTGRADFIEDLDGIPLPAYHKIDFFRYGISIQRESIDGPRDLPYATIQTSRGCPYDCCFCEVKTISGKKPRLRSVGNIIREIEWLIETYATKALIFVDDNLLMDRERAKELFKVLARYNLKWNILALAVCKLDEELIRLMAEGGCKYVGISWESGVERVLREIVHKPLNLGYAERMVGFLKRHGIDMAGAFIVGFPGETWQEIRQTIEYAAAIDVDYIKINIAQPLPNTELYKIAKEGGYLIRGFRHDRHLWAGGWIETGEFRPEDLRVLRAYEWDRINFTDPGRREKIRGMMGVTGERLAEIRRLTLEKANPSNRAWTQKKSPQGGLRGGKK